MEQIKLNDLEYIEKLSVPNAEPEYLIIWLHGLGADCNDFLPIIPELRLTSCVKFVFPNAPYRPITINNGYEMRAWYDIRDLTKLGDTVDREGILTSVHQIESLIASFVRAGWKSEKIFLAGFSQGGVISYTTALLSEFKLAGVLAFSCYFPDVEDLAKRTTVNKKTPFLACHGKHDVVIPYNVGLNAYNVLRNDGFNISWMHYPMEHGVCADELRDISLWINEKIM